MRNILNTKFKNLDIYEKAEELTKILKHKKIDSIDYIISGLPFTVLEKDISMSILEQVYDNLNKDGKFITFQYSLDLLKYLKKKYEKVEVKLVPLNIPMAYVYVCTK